MLSRYFISFISSFPHDYHELFRRIWVDIRELSRLITRNKGIIGVWRWQLFIIALFLLIVFSIIRIILFPVSFLIKTVQDSRRLNDFSKALARGDYDLDFSEPMDNSEDYY